ncbi:reticulocyte binding protein 2b (RBP2b) [Plasmodium ovale curtisi]|uniref:Reticulocyte binding protein 2b (RBP2b) n=7 Tax=Plasmodium ovale TaxID=36330 RepID=A0A1A8WFB7_PLAOA|nr:reticulocyte binding protein 2b (RBP2b) [Plasmodium ovale curtisi]
MQRRALWTFLFNTLLILSASSKDKNDSRLFPESSNLRRNNKFEYNDGEREHKNNIINANGVNKTYLPNKTSFVTLKNHTSTKTPNYYAYIKENNIYTPNGDNDTNLRKIVELNILSNAFIEESRTREIVPNNPESNPMLETTDTLDYIDGTDNEKNIISQLKPDYSYVYYFNEIKRYAEYHKEISPKYESIYNSSIKTLKEYIENAVDTCKPKKNEMIALTKILEDPEKIKGLEGHYEGKLHAYKTYMKEYQNCLINKSNKTMPQIRSLKYDINELLSDINCKQKCSNETYNNMIKIYLLEFNNVPYETHIQYIKNFKSSLDFGNHLINRVQRELGKNNIIDSTKFLQEEIKYIIERFYTHLDKVKYGMDYIKDLSKKEVLNEVTIDVLKNNYITLPYYYALFKFSSENIIILERELRNKDILLRNLFTKLEDELEKKVITFIDSEYYLPSGASIISESEKILTKGIEAYNGNAKLGENLALHSNSQIINIKMDYESKRAQLDDSLHKLKELIATIKENYKVNTSEKQKIDIEKKKSPDVSSQERSIKLLDLIETVNVNKPKISSNFKKIEEDYKKVKELKKQIEGLVASIQKDEKDLEKLTENEKNNSSIKEEIKKHMDYIITNINSVKRLISSKDEIKENIGKMEKLINEESSDTVQFTNEKEKISSNIKTIITDFYKDDLKAFVKNMSEFVDKHENYMTKAYTKEEMDEMKNETKKEHRKIEEMKCEGISRILDKLKKESDNLSSLKEEIINNRLENIHTQLSNLFSGLKQTHTDLTSRISSYKEGKTKLEKHKTSITEREKKFVDGTYEHDKEVIEGKDTYNEFLQDKCDILNKGNTISNDILIFKEKTKDTEIKLPLHKDTVKKLKTLTTKEFTKIDTLIQSHEKENANLKISDEDEKEFNKTKKEINEIIDKIEISNHNIGIIKVLNIAVKHFEANKKLIDTLIENKSKLTEKIKNHTDAIKSDKIIEQNEKNKFETALNKEVPKINAELADESIQKLKTEIEQMLTYCKEKRQNIKKPSETRLEEPETAKTNWNNIEVQIAKLNMSYEILNVTIDNLIKESYIDVITHIHELTTSENRKICEKTEKHTNFLEEMKVKLNSLNFNNDFKEKAKNTVQENVTKYNQNVQSTLEKINGNYTKISGIKKRSTEYMGTSTEEKNKNMEFSEKVDEKTVFNQKKEKIENIYEQIKAVFNELEGLEKEENILKEVSNAELAYERILIDDIVTQINDEDEKAKANMKKIESAMQNIQQLKTNGTIEEQMKIAGFEYEKMHQKCKTHSDKIQEFLKNAQTKKGEANKNEKIISEVKEFKNEIKKFKEEVLKERNAMLNGLKEIENIHKLLTVDNPESIADDIAKNKKNADEFKKQTLEAIQKVNDLIIEAETKLNEAKNHKSQINTNLAIDKIDAEVDKIKQIHEDIIKKEKDMKKFLVEAEEHIEKLVSEVNEANRGKEKIDYLQKGREHSATTLNNINMEVVDKNIDICKQISNEVAAAETETKKKYESFLKTEKLFTFLNESIILAMKAKSEKRKIEAEEILTEITKDHSTIKAEMQKYKETLNQLNKKPNFNDVEDVFSNNKSTVAIVSLHSQLDRITHDLSSIENINKDVESIFAATKSSMDTKPEISEVTVEDTLENAKYKEGKYIELLNDMKKQKERFAVEQSKIDAIKRNIEDIEKKLEENKTNYETGLLEKISDIAKERKLYMDTTKESLTSSISMFATLFNGIDLKEYNIKKYLEDYKKKIDEINNEFQVLYNSIENKAKEVSEKTSDYTKAKEVREKVQEEERNLKNKEKEVKKYLDDIRKKESFRLIYHMRERLDNLNEMSKEEYSSVNRIHEDIKQLIEEIKKLPDEDSLSDIFKQAEDKNKGIQSTNHYSYKDEAQILLNHIVTSANFIDIKVLTGLQPSDLNEQGSSQEAVELKFEPEYIPKLETTEEYENRIELDVYNNIKNAHKNVLEIFKFSNNVNAKKKECENLTKEGKGVFLRMKSINELKGKLNKANSKSRIVSSKIDDSLNKLSALNNIKCTDDENYNTILENSEFQKLKERSTSFKEKKGKTAIESKLTEMKEKIAKHPSTIKGLEEKVEALNANENDNEVIQKEISPTDEFLKAVEILEGEITKINTSFDEALKEGKECQMFIHTSLKESINAKLTTESALIHKKHQKAQEYLEYVKNNYDSLNNFIVTLNRSFDTQKVSNYDLTNVEEANRLSAQLATASNALEGTIKEIRNEFAFVNEESENYDLQKSVEKLKTLYTTLESKKNSINEILKNISLLNVKEMLTCSKKHSDLVDQFKNIISTQKEKLSSNQKSIEGVKQNLRDKENEIAGVNGTFTLESINKFDKIHSDIMTDIGKLKELEEINNKEDQKVQIYIERSSQLVQRNTNLLSQVNNFEKDDELIKEKGDTNSGVKGDITTTKENINNAEKNPNKLLEGINENKELYNTNDTNNFISEILKKVEDVRGNFIKNIPTAEKSFKIESNLNDIKDFINEIKNDCNVDEFIATMSKNTEERIKSSKNLENVQKVIETINAVRGYEEETKNKLHKITTVLDRIKARKKEMDDLFKTISKENINSYNSSKNCVDDSEKLIKEFDNYVHKMTDIVDKAEGAINELEVKKKAQKDELNQQQKEIIEIEEESQKELKEIHKISREEMADIQAESTRELRDVDDESLKELRDVDNESLKELRDVDDESLGVLRDIEHESTDTVNNSYDSENNLLDSSEEQVWNINTDYSEHEQSENDDHSNARYSERKKSLAGGIIIGFSICSSIALILFMNKGEDDLNSYDRHFEGNDNFNIKHKDEITEIRYNENDYFS